MKLIYKNQLIDLFDELTIVKKHASIGMASWGVMRENVRFTIHVEDYSMQHAKYERVAVPIHSFMIQNQHYTLQQTAFVPALYDREQQAVMILTQEPSSDLPGTFSIPMLLSKSYLGVWFMNSFDILPHSNDVQFQLSHINYEKEKDLPP